MGERFMYIYRSILSAGRRKKLSYIVPAYKSLELSKICFVVWGEERTLYQTNRKTTKHKFHTPLKI